MKNKVLRSLDAIAFLVFVVMCTALDSDNIIPYVIASVAGCYLIIRTIADNR